MGASVARLQRLQASSRPAPAEAPAADARPPCFPAPSRVGIAASSPAEIFHTVSTQSALLKVMSDAARKAARGLNRDFGELAELQVAKKAPPKRATI